MGGTRAILPHEDSPHEVTGFTVDAEYLSAESFKGLPVVAFEEVDKHFPPDQFRLFIPIGFAEMNTSAPSGILTPSGVAMS